MNYEILFYIITLESEADRVNWVNTHILPKLSSESSIYYGIDGRIMTQSEINSWINHNYLQNNYKINPSEKIPFRKGQIGCALSHIRLWEIVRDQLKGDLNNNRIICIFEDDVEIIDPKVNEIIQQISIELPTDWDHCNLYHHPKFQKQLRDPNNHLTPNLMKGVAMWGTVAYLINRRGINKLLKHCKPIFNTIDEMIKVLITKQVLKSYTIKIPFIDTVGSTVSTDTTNPQLKSTIWGSQHI